MNKSLSAQSWSSALLLVILWHGSLSNLHANVYATNIRLNGGTNNITLSASNAISYILNEPATAGVRIDITSGSNIIRSITLTSGGPGALRGTNRVIWNGKDGGGNSLAVGTYAVSITAMASGYDNWTQISSDNNDGNYVWEARGLAVNRNTNSIYYGRVFVANSDLGPGGHNGDKLGLQKLNADGSPADEGGFSDGGYNWSGNYGSPWKVQVAADDRVFVSDLSAGVVLSFDEVLSSNSVRSVLGANNYPPGSSPYLDGLFVSGVGATARLWLTDYNAGGLGVARWNIAANGTVASSDTGSTIVSSTPPSDLNGFPADVALDNSNRIFAIQTSLTRGDAANRLLRFPAYTNSSQPETNADWKIGAGDDSMGGALAVAVDPTGTYVGVAFRGINPNSTGFEAGSVGVFATSNGAPIVTLNPGPLTYHDHTAVAWDNVGNLYAADDDDGIWRVYSPPGTNFATTVAVPQVLVTLPLSLSAPSYAAAQFQFTLNGQPNVSYVILSSTNLQDWAPVATNVSPNATRVITVSAPGRRSFYRAVVGP